MHSFSGMCVAQLKWSHQMIFFQGRWVSVMRKRSELALNLNCWICCINYCYKHKDHGVRFLLSNSFMPLLKYIVLWCIFEVSWWYFNLFRQVTRVWFAVYGIPLSWECFSPYIWKPALKQEGCVLKLAIYLII